MQIILLSDSHGRTDRLEKLFHEAEKLQIKHIIHAGDFAVYDVEKIFAAHPKINFYIAKGNCDVNPEVLEKIQKLPNCILSEIVNLELEGIKFSVSHIEGFPKSKLKKNTDIFCHGHTHRTKIEEHEGFKVLNPGALCEDSGFFIISLPKVKIKRFKIKF